MDLLDVNTGRRFWYRAVVHLHLRRFSLDQDAPHRMPVGRN
jgi:hypothetical protein